MSLKNIDKDYALKILMAGINVEDKEALKQGLQELIGGSSSGEGVDWNENDETSPAFVKNRTHYMTNEIIPEQTVIASMSNHGFYLAKINDMRSGFEVGKQYTVWWNSTQYECIATELGIGNVYLITGKEEGNTGEPFFISNGGVVTDSEGEQTIKAIAQDNSFIVPIDIGFIPDIPHSKLLNNGIISVDIGRISHSPTTGLSDHYIQIKEALESGDYTNIQIKGKLESEEEISTKWINIDQYSFITEVGIPNPSGTGYITEFEIHAQYQNAYWLEGDNYAIICNNTYGPLNKDKMLYLKSSTEGSKKQFRITVDDSGTISATEVTG